MSAAAEMVRVLPADVYDALELSALAFGGIGAGLWFEGTTSRRGEIPCCVHGHAIAVDDALFSRVGMELYRVNITMDANDAAVGRGNKIHFATWCRRLNVVRGTEPTYDAEFVKSLASRVVSGLECAR